MPKIKVRLDKSILFYWSESLQTSFGEELRSVSAKHTGIDPSQIETTYSLIDGGVNHDEILVAVEISPSPTLNALPNNLAVDDWRNDLAAVVVHYAQQEETKNAFHTKDGRPCVAGIEIGFTPMVYQRVKLE